MLNELLENLADFGSTVYAKLTQALAAAIRTSTLNIERASHSVFLIATELCSCCLGPPILYGCQNIVPDIIRLRGFKAKKIDNVHR